MITTAQRPDAEEQQYLARVHPNDWQNPQPREIYDLAILGAGPAGIAAAELAVRHGFTVALIERSKLGGNSLNGGSVPSKAIIRTANIYARMQDAEEFGVPMPVEPAVDFAQVMARMRAIRSRIAEYHSARRFALKGVDLFFGSAQFSGQTSLLVAGASVLFKKALIATGARPRPSNIPGLDQVGYRTSNSVFEMTGLSKRIAVIGGGPLGCELAQALQRLGPQVTIIQNDPKFLPREERDAAEILSRSMARCGVVIRLNTMVTGARMDGDVKILETSDNDVKADIATDEVILSIGRVPNVEELALEMAGIVCDGDRGIAVDEFLSTANHNIYAAGDVCMELKFTNAAQASARIAAENALLGAARRHTDLIIPRCTYCDPEIAHVGLHVWDAHRGAIPIKSYTVLMHDVDRAITDGQDHGFVKIHIEDGTDRILGATIMASRASELINEMTVILSAGIGMTALAQMTHTYPAQSEAIQLAAQAFVADQIKTAKI